MLLSHLRLAWRNLFRKKGFTLFNIGGLTVGIASFILLAIYINHELSYDTFHRHADNIYRIRHDTYKGNRLEASTAITYYGASPAIRESFPQLQNYVRLHRADGMINYYRQDGEVVSHHEFNAFYADTSFFSIFSFQLKNGDPRSVLRNPNSMLISESAAKKYFGDQNPVGQSLKLTTQWQGGEYLIEGILEDVPENSHLKFDFLFPIESLLSNGQFKYGAWYWTNFYTYLLLKDGVDPVAFEKDLSKVIDEHLGRELRKSGLEEKFILQPLTDIHLHSNIGGEARANHDYYSVVFLMILAAFIITIVLLNYVNLSTARSAERLREIGVRKVLGSSKRSITWQFMTETFLVYTIALVLSLLAVAISLPFFTELIGSHLLLEWKESSQLIGIVILIIVTGIIFSASYPALVLSRFNAVSALKGNTGKSSNRIILRRVLIAFQFCAASGAIVATLLVYQQLTFMINQPLGVNIEQKIVLRAPKIIEDKSFMNSVRYFKGQLSMLPDIGGVTASSEVPGHAVFWTGELRTMHEDNHVRHLMNILVADEDFIPTYNVLLLAGRNFRAGSGYDYGNVVIINETALKHFGFKDAQDALGEDVILNGLAAKKIVGVTADYHQQSLKASIQPTIMQFIPWTSDFITVQFQGNDLQGIINNIQTVFQKAFPGNAFEYFFLDNHYHEQYENEKRLLRIFNIFSTISIFSACLGLFGLSSYVIIRRKREIAIRKVLGASIDGIVRLLTTEYIWLILAALAVSIPLTWYFIDMWMENFAYRPEISWWYFACGGVVTLVLALLTIGANVVRAALTNPAQSIKSE